MVAQLSALRLTLPLPPNRGNARWHWRVENRKKQLYMTEAAVWRSQNGTKRPTLPLERARLSVCLFTWATMDEDNLWARTKWTRDFLKHDGWIEDDSPRVLMHDTIAQRIDRKNPRIEITLEPVA